MTQLIATLDAAETNDADADATDGLVEERTSGPVAERRSNRDSRPDHLQLRVLISDSYSTQVDPMMDELASTPAQQEVLTCYKLIEQILNQSYLELMRKSSQRLEMTFWQSRRADFFVSLYSEMREQLGMAPITTEAMRRGLAKKLDKPTDWLMPDDDMTPREVEAFCAEYMQQWEALVDEFPGGVPDAESDKQFIPMDKAKLKADKAKSNNPYLSLAHSQPSLDLDPVLSKAVLGA